MLFLFLINIFLKFIKTDNEEIFIDKFNILLIDNLIIFSKEYYTNNKIYKLIKKNYNNNLIIKNIKKYSNYMDRYKVYRLKNNFLIINLKNKTNIKKLFYKNYKNDYNSIKISFLGDKIFNIKKISNKIYSFKKLSLDFIKEDPFTIRIDFEYKNLFITSYVCELIYFLLNLISNNNYIIKEFIKIIIK